VAWVRRFVRYHSMCHPDELGSEEVNAFLTYLAVERRASAATQSQARAVLLFFLRRRAEFSGGVRWAPPNPIRVSPGLRSGERRGASAE